MTEAATPSPDLDRLHPRRPPHWWSPSLWWNRGGNLAATGWVRAFDTVDRSVHVSRIGTGHGPGAIAVGHGGIWVANRRSRTVARLDPETLEMTAIQQFRKPPVAIAVGPSAIWAAGSNGWVWRLWPDARAEGIARLGPGATAIAEAGGLIWVLRRNGRLYRLEAASGEVEAEHRLSRGAAHMVARDGVLWIACGRGRRLLLFDPRAGRTEATIRLPRRVRCLSLGGDVLYAGCARTLSPSRGRLHAIDRATSQVASETELPGQPRAIVGDGPGAWVACGKAFDREGSILRIEVPGDRGSQFWATDWVVGSLALNNGTLLAAMSIELAVPVFDGHLAGAGGDFGGGGGEGGGSG